MAAFNQEATSTERAQFQDPDPVSWRKLELELSKASGGVLEITMLRRLEWLTEHDVEVGGTVALDMPELGAKGDARVLGVYPCPEIKPGPGQVVTATFAHPATHQVLDITISEGEAAETIGVERCQWLVDIRHPCGCGSGVLHWGRTAADMEIRVAKFLMDRNRFSFT